MMKTHCSLPFVLLILVEFNYVTTTSVADQFNLQQVSNLNSRPLVIEQTTAHLYRESFENDQDEDMVEDADLSPSEVIETHVLPDTSPDSDDSLATGVNGVQRVQRRRRRRRRRKRPKPSIAPVSATSAATAAPSKQSDGFDAYYAVSEDEIRRKPLKYHRESIVDENEGPVGSQAQFYDGGGDGGVVDGYPRRRQMKRRRRPLKRPVDDYAPPLNIDHDDVNNKGDESWSNPENHANVPSHGYRAENTTTTVPSTPITTTTTVTTLITHSIGSITRKPDLFKSTTMMNRNELSKEDASQSSKATTAALDVASEQDSDNSLKRGKRPAPRKIQSKNYESSTPVNQQHKLIEQNVVVKLGHDENSKSIDNRKELFKLRRPPPTWAILGHAKFVANKTDSSHDKNVSHNNVKQTDFDQFETATVAKNNLVREPEQRPGAAYFKTSTVTSVVSQSPSVDNEKNETAARKKLKDSESVSGGFPIPIITTYTGQQQHGSKSDIDDEVINSNASAFLSANDQRLTIIYVPCNQTVSSTSLAADKLLKHAGATFFHPIDENLPKSYGANSSATESSTTEGTTAQPRKISTTRSPSGEQLTFSDESGIEDSTKLSSTSHTTTSVTSSSSSTTNVNREPKLYQDTDAKSKLKTELAKEDRQSSSWQIRKPYPSPVISPSASKPLFGSSKEIIFSYTTTTNSPPSLFSYHNIDSAEEPFQLGNNSQRDSLLHRKTVGENTHLVNNIKQHHQHQQQHHHVERKKLPLAVKSAIIISGAVLALAVLGFFALLLSCKIRQAKSRMKCHRQLYRDQFQSNEFRQSSRSTSPVMSKSNFNTRNFANNMQPPNVAPVDSNRNYYLWQTLRKTFQYD